MFAGIIYLSPFLESGLSQSRGLHLLLWVPGSYLSHSHWIPAWDNRPIKIIDFLPNIRFMNNEKILNVQTTFHSNDIG